jgi:hypothetical protein
MKSIGLIFLSLFFSVVASAEKVFDYNSTCQQAYLEFTKLRIEPGLALIAKAKKQNPDNLIPIMLEDYADFFDLFFNEDPKDFENKLPHFNERMAKISEGPKNSPYYNFCLSTIRIHKAAVEIKFGQNWNAGWDFRRAFLLLKENRKNHPDFVLDDMMMGALYAVIGTLPSGYKWLASLLGLKGSIVEGMALLHRFTYSNDPWAKLYSNESNFIYPFLLFYIENKREEAVAFAQQRNLDLVNNHLLCFMTANLAINNKQTALAGSVMMNRNMSPDYLKLSVWDFEMGYVKLYHLELNEAIKYLEQFQKDFKGNFYRKDANSKLSYAYYLQGNMEKAIATRNEILKKGSTDTDADKKALKDAKAGGWPNNLLLRSRFLNDGGFHKEALALLAGKSLENFTSEEDKLEFSYRVARIVKNSMLLGLHCKLDRSMKTADKKPLL